MLFLFILSSFSKADDSVLEVLITSNSNSHGHNTSNKIKSNYTTYNTTTSTDDDDEYAQVDYNHSSDIIPSMTSMPSALSLLTTASSSASSLTTASSSSSSLPTTTTATKVDINYLKKELKRISNQRAILIASKLSGINQDVDLKLSELRLVKIDHEINIWKASYHRGDKKIDLKKFHSDFVKLSDDTNFRHEDVLIEDLILQLEEHKKGVKDEVR